MLIVIALVLFILWGLGFYIFPALGLFIHVLLILAVSSLIWHFLKERSRTRV